MNIVIVWTIKGDVGLEKRCISQYNYDTGWRFEKAQHLSCLYSVRVASSSIAMCTSFNAHSSGTIDKNYVNKTGRGGGWLSR